MIDAHLIDAENTARMATLRADYDALGESLDRRGIDIAAIKARVARYGVAVPSWVWAPAAPALPAFRDWANRAISLTSWMIAA
jgi:L-rhamnose isomerase